MRLKHTGPVVLAGLFAARYGEEATYNDQEACIVSDKRRKPFKTNIKKTCLQIAARLTPIFRDVNDIDTLEWENGALAARDKRKKQVKEVCDLILKVQRLLTAIE